MTGKYDASNPRAASQIPQGSPHDRSDPVPPASAERKIPPLHIPSTAQPSAKFSPEFQPAIANQVSDQSPPQPSQRRILPLQLQLPKSWQFWGIATIVALGSVGALSVAVLLKLPALPNCPAVFWPTASASLRLYCAQLASEKRTLPNLLEAIALVKDLPSDHPLRPEVDRNLEQWASDILTLADAAFQRGELKKAIDAAQKIPTTTAAAKLVKQQIKDWNETWASAYRIYKESEKALEKQDLKEAFLIATRLLSVPNQYWQTTKYRELTGVINATRKDVEKLTKAQGFAEQGGLDNFIAAIRLAEEINDKSRIYKQVQLFVAKVGKDMLDLAKDAMSRRDFDEAAAIARQIPTAAGLEAEVEDFSTLADAESQAWGGSVSDLQAAILAAQKLKRDRPLYSRAQELIAIWKLEIQDVAYLDQAKDLASGGGINDLAAAVNEASKIPSGNPRYDEARQEIARWQDTIQTVEDRPILDRADQLAEGGNVNALQSAIDEVSRIGKGRSLSADADQRIADWSDRIHRIQDQPKLDRARQLADLGDLAGAIAIANQIGSNRTLYSDAQADIRDWNDRLEINEDQPRLEQARALAEQGDLARAIATARQIPANRNLYNEAQNDIQSWQNQSAGLQRMQQAYALADVGSQSSLLSAIQIADQISTDSPARAEAEQMISEWSYDLLQLAENRSDQNPLRAIAIAESIPPNTPAYDAAQGRIQVWRLQLPIAPR
ncbi:MAG: chromosome segregation ATPase [Timaviella obliquedivisa GSE-PSE-MK23-08B]|jgi:soluble cytochrome b562|nr:chromosome segregation ATPase [Timaviella obliquedivisa GSE-PSE-MK23-08B]